MHADPSQVRQHLLSPAGEVYTAIDAGADGSHAIAIVAPEPSSLSLLALGSLILLRRRSRSNPRA